MSWSEDMIVFRIKLSDFFSFFFCVYLFILTYSFHDSSYIKSKQLVERGHTFSKFACFISFNNNFFII